MVKDIMGNSRKLDVAYVFNVRFGEADYGD